MIRNHGDWLRILPHKRPMQQFEHYKYLADTLLPKNPTAWVFFTDDDDLSHPTRTVNLWHGVQRAAASNAVYTFAENGIVSIEGSHEDFKSANEITAPTDLSDCSTSSYQSYCLPLKLLHDFCSNSSPTLLRHRFADMGLVHFLRVGHSLPTIQCKFDKGDWLYFWRHCPDLQSNSVNPQDEDQVCAGDQSALKRRLLSNMDFADIYGGVCQCLVAERAANAAELLRLTKREDRAMMKCQLQYRAKLLQPPRLQAVQSN